MTAEALWTEFVRFLSQAAVVGLGWYVVHRFSVVRDRDKARREMVVEVCDSLCEKVDALFDLAIEYHSVDRAVQSERKLKTALQDFAAHLQSMSDIVSEPQGLGDCRKSFISLRRSISSRHFEDEHEGPLPQDASQFQSIAAAVSDMKRTLYALKHSQFPVEK